MKSKNKKLVLFDFDGVLVDTLRIVFSINQEIHLNLSLEEYKSFFEGNIYSAVRKDGTIKKHHPNFFDLYDLKTREIIVPQVLKLTIKKLIHNYNLIVVSSTNTESIRKILEREGILNYFIEILGADIEKDKSVKINLILKKYKILKNDIVFITDTLGDIREAEKCGIKSIVVTWGFHDEKTLKKGNPIKIVNNPGDLFNVINNVLK